MTPDPHEQDATTVIADAIAAGGGWIPFARHMELALYAPGVGYYTSGRQKFGAHGDFVTASGISRLFGASLARQVAEVCSLSAPHVLEFGAGNGALAADLLDSLGGEVETYSILELSPALRQLQQETLRARAPDYAARVRWLDSLPSRFNGCVIANEVLDAMPVHLLSWSDQGIDERGVIVRGDALAFEDRPARGTVLETASELSRRYAIHPPYVSEINLAAGAWVASMAEVLESGALLLIDYGFPGPEYYHPQRATGTLMCHQRHCAGHDPLAEPGNADITAHVDFSAVAAAGSAARLDVLGYASQASFLINCGITDLLAETPASDSTAYLPLANQVNCLLSPAEMGELFKVMALGRGIGDELSGFARGDRRHSL